MRIAILMVYKTGYYSDTRLNNTFRLIDDIATVNSDGIFQELVGKFILSLILNKENKIYTSAFVLDLSINITKGKFIVEALDKWRDITSSWCKSQLIKYFRIYNDPEGFEKRVETILDVFLDLKFYLVQLFLYMYINLRFY